MNRSPVLIPRQAWVFLTPLLWIGIGGRYPFVLFGENGLTIGAVFWGIVTPVALIFALRRGGDPRLRALVPRALAALWVAGPLLAGALDLLQWRHFSSYGYRFPAALLALDVLAAALFLFRPGLRRAESAIVFFALHRAISIWLFPLDTGRSDMLVAILQAGDRFLSGGAPYGPSLPGTGRMPYFPLTWFAYLPSALFGFDPRWLGIVMTVAAGFILLRWIDRTDAKDGLSERLLALFFLNPYLAFRHELYLDPLFLVVALVLVARRPLLLAIACGAALATSHWSWVLIPFLILRAVPLGEWRRLLQVGAGALAVAALILIPFIAPAPDLFVEAVFMHLDVEGEGLGGELVFGLSPFAHLLNLERLLQPLQVLMLAAAAYAALRAFAAKRPIGPAYASSALLIFVALNPFLESYFYLPALFSVSGED